MSASPTLARSSPRRHVSGTFEACPSPLPCPPARRASRCPTPGPEPDSPHEPESADADAAGADLGDAQWDGTWNPVSPRLARARLVVTLPWPLLIALGAATGAVVASIAWLWAVAGVGLLAAAWLAWLIPRQVRAIGYAERRDDLVTRRGVMFRTQSVLPYGRLQYLEVQQGPVLRRLGLATLDLNTATPSTDARIPGLPMEAATRLRDQLTARGESDLVGL